MSNPDKIKVGFFNSLIWKIGSTFLLILIILSAVYIYISVNTANLYFQETNQKLNIEVADHIADEQPAFINGEVNEKALQDFFHYVMVLNPNLEVYLLDTDGKILTYFAPYKIIKLEYVPLEPIKEFISEKGESFILGGDPKNEKKKKAFSAAEVYEGDKHMGYIYVILGGEEFENASQILLGSYILGLGVRSMTITFAAAVIISLVALGFITRNLKKIIHVICNFQGGDLNARINVKGKSELSEFSKAFNNMADKIVSNIEEIKTMDNLRRELVANVSHDLRTPLATIQGYLETIIIKKEKLSDEEKFKYITTILKSTERLKNLVEELFELSKLEAREKRPKPEPFSIAELAQDIHQKNLLLANEKRIALKIDFSYDLPFVYADIQMMEKVIQNLLENAIKFTPSNGVITIKLSPQSENMLVQIADTGCGIKEEDLPYIFDRYHQSKRTKNNNNEGLGLGLAIVKKILEVHEIDIDVKSTVNKGTTFSFEIPLFKKEKTNSKKMQLT